MNAGNQNAATNADFHFLFRLSVLYAALIRQKLQSVLFLNPYQL